MTTPSESSYITCEKCGGSKPPECFHLSTKRPSGRQAWCRSCVKDYGAYRKENGIVRVYPRAPIGFKICHRISCSYNGSPQPVENFNKSRQHPKSGLNSACKGCISHDQKECRDGHPGHNATRCKEWYEDNIKHSKDGARLPIDNANPSKMRWTKQHWAAKKVSECRKRATGKGIPFDIQISDLFPLPVFCPVLQIRLDYNSGPDKRRHASVDRIFPILGYIKGNIRIISRSANLAKIDSIGDLVVRRRPLKSELRDDSLQPYLFADFKPVYEAAD